MLKSINNGDEPIIIADYKFDGTRIGDYIGSFIEHMYLNRHGINASEIRKYTIQFMTQFMPILIRQKSDGSWYRGDDIFAFDGKSMSVLPGVIKNPELYDDEVYLFKQNSFNAKEDVYSLGVIPMSSDAKKSYSAFKKNYFIFHVQTCTDDTKCGTDIIKAVLKHGDEYKLSDDNKKYKFVSDDSNFANTKTNENNFEDGYMRELAGNLGADWAYTQGGEFGNSAIAELRHMCNVYCQQQKNKAFNFSEEIKKYKKTGHQGKSFANGCVMRLGPTIFFAQGFKQGLKLAEISVRNTHDHPLSIKSARAVATTGMCANYGLRRETIRKIVHFLYYDPDPLKGTGVSYDDDWPENYCTFDFLSHRKENSTSEQMQKADEEKLNALIEDNQFTDRSLPTAFLAINICLTSKCAEEAASRILRAAGDCDTIGATAIPIVAALFGLPADWVNRIWAISMSKTLGKPMTNLKPNESNTKDENYQDNPKNIKVFDKKGRFIEHNEVSRMANEKFKHHYREYAPIEWQLKNICELMEYLKEQEKNSKAVDKEQLLKEIFADIKSDINFMLDKNQEYELEELSQDVKNTLENMQEIAENEIKDDTKWKQKLKQEYAEYKLKVNKHRNATAKFQTKMKNQKLDNLTKENIAHINEEIGPINKIFREHGVGEVSVAYLKPKNKPIENNDLAQTQEKLNHTNELEDTNGAAPVPVAVVKQNGLKNLDVSDISVVQAKNQNQINGDKNQTNKVEDGKNQQKENIDASHPKKEIVTTNKGKGKDNGLERTQKKLDDIHNQENTSETSAAHDFVGNQNNLQNLKGGAKAGSQSKNGDIAKENNVQKVDVVIPHEEQVNNKQTMQNQNGMNHKPFVLSGSALLIADILFFVFKSSLTPFPAVIGTVGTVLLLFVWFYKTFPSRSEQSVGNGIGNGSKDEEQPLVKDNLTKTAEINGSVPLQAPLTNDNKTK